MSNITLFQSGPLAIPDFLRNATDDVTKSLVGNGGGKSISIKGGVWRMIVDGEEVARNEERGMKVIVVAANPNVNRTYHDQQYQEGVDIPPKCWSNDGKQPDAEVPPEGRQAASCATCPQNVSGSGANGSRACRFSRRLAVVLENDLQGGVYRIQLPAKSLFGKPNNGKMPLDAYAKFLHGHGVPITGVVTEMRFDTSEAVPVVHFNATRPLSEPEWYAVKDLGLSPEATAAVEFKITPRKKDGEAPVESAQYQEPAPRPAPRAQAPVAAPAPAPWQDEPEPAAAAPVPEPTRRPRKTAEVPPAAAPAPAAVPGTVNDILNRWGSDDEGAE